MRTLIVEPRGPFDLSTARDFAGGFAAGIGSRAATDRSILMAFPVEGWAASAVVQVRQDGDGRIRGDVFGDADLETIERQTSRSLSLDHDGAGWPDVGRRDPIVGRQQERFGFLRPVCFFSAYEAATSFVIGQRISMVQVRRVKERLAEQAGDAIDVELDGERRTIHAFPRPQQLLTLTEIPGVAPVKVERLHGLARAALDGRLATERLRGLPEDEALAELRQLPGIGEWTSRRPHPRLRLGRHAPARRPDQPRRRPSLPRARGTARRRRLARDRRGVAAVSDVGDGPAPHGLAARSARTTELSPGRGSATE